MRAWVLAAIVPAACAGRDAAPVVTSERPLVVAMPGPAAGAATRDAVAINRGCEGCHTAIATEWRGSLHRVSWTHPDFARAFAREPQPFCQGCHAPEADPREDVPEAAGELGVGCVTCHVPHASSLGGGVLAAPTEAPASAPAQHELVRTVAFAQVDACAGCHEFDFPGRTDLLMQSTVTEHAQSRFAELSCADCHMPMIPDGVGDPESAHRSHAFGASRDPQMLRRAVVVDARRTGEDTLRVRLAPGEVGHAFPTGDLFRRLWVEAEALDADGDPVSYDGVPLARHFVDRPRGEHKTLRVVERDDRPGAPALADDGGVIEIDLSLEHGGSAVRWRVWHQRIDAPTRGDVEVSGETLVAEGILPATAQEEGT